MAVRFVLGSFLIFACLPALSAQLVQSAPAFEAATVKPAQPGGFGPGPLAGGPGSADPERLAGRASLKALVMRAYSVKDYQVKGPEWMDTARYDLAAKVPAGASKADVAAMLQSLLAEQFHFAAHTETREQPVYFLRAAKGGPRLAPAKARDGNGLAFTPPRTVRGADGFPEFAAGSDVARSFESVVGGPDGLLYKLWARNETMEKLADRLSSHLDRPAIDKTGIAGSFDFSLAWSVESMGGRIPRTNPPPDEIDSHDTPVLGAGGVSIFAALPAQLGLRLEAAKARLRTVVVDRADRVPAGN